MIKMAYRPSFTFVLRGEVIHIAVQGGELTACDKDVKECRPLYNILLELPKLDNAKYCKKCREVYHLRDEKAFPPIP